MQLLLRVFHTPFRPNMTAAASELIASFRAVQVKLVPGCRLVAVSKTKPPEMLQELYDAGQRHFGENYVSDGLRGGPVQTSASIVGPLV